MNNAKMNYAVDAALAVAGLAVSATGIALHFFLPSGGGHSGESALFGIEKSAWVAVHDWSGLAFILLMAAHMALHLPWVWCMTKGFFSKKGDSCKRI